MDSFFVDAAGLRSDGTARRVVIYLFLCGKGKKV